MLRREDEELWLPEESVRTILEALGGDSAGYAEQQCNCGDGGLREVHFIPGDKKLQELVKKLVEQIRIEKQGQLAEESTLEGLR